MVTIRRRMVTTCTRQVLFSNEDLLRILIDLTDINPDTAKVGYRAGGAGLRLTWTEVETSEET